MSHADGTIVVYDKERDDGVFSASVPSSPPPTSNPLRSNSASLEQTNMPSQPQEGAQWDPLTTIHVTTPPWHPESAVAGKERPDKGTAKNPVSHWRISTRGVLGMFVRTTIPSSFQICIYMQISCSHPTSSMLLRYQKMVVYVSSMLLQNS